MNALALIVAFALGGVLGQARRDPAPQPAAPRADASQTDPLRPGSPPPGTARPPPQPQAVPRTGGPAPSATPQPPSVPPRRYGRFDVDLTK
jgi:hypothetical protein